MEIDAIIMAAEAAQASHRSLNGSLDQPNGQTSL